MKQSIVGWKAAAILLGLFGRTLFGDAGQAEPAGRLIVNHKNFKFCDKSDKQKFARVARLRIFIAHSGKEEAILAGIKDLHDEYSERYPLKVESAGDRPIGPSRLGTIYEYDRGDPGSGKKISSFELLVGNGWRVSSADVAFNLFASADKDANVTSYLQSMATLEEVNRGTLFVYATIPLEADDPDGNARRELFNYRLRKFAAANDKPLLDIADIESYSASGKPSTCSSNGHTYRSMNPDYQGKGITLNGIGAQRLAKGLISLLELAAVP